jgi:hypothetical protein
MALIIRGYGRAKRFILPDYFRKCVPDSERTSYMGILSKYQCDIGSFGVFMVMTSNGRGDKILDTVENYMECLRL